MGRWNGLPETKGKYLFRYVGGAHVPIHQIVAEKALGRTLPLGAVVHHVNGNGHDNRTKNLVICQDRRYHNYLHQRMRVKAAGGDPNTQRICCTCKRVVLMVDMTGGGISRTECKACHAARHRRRYQRVKVITYG